MYDNRAFFHVGGTNEILSNADDVLIEFQSRLIKFLKPNSSRDVFKVGRPSNMMQ